MDTGKLTKLILAIASFICGVPPNAFILAVNVRFWIKGGCQFHADLILSTLGLFNIITISWQIVWNFLNFFVSDALVLKYLYLFYTFSFGTILSSSWITAWLCILYCIKIISFQHRLVIYLKLRFHTLLPRLLSGSIMFLYSLMALMLVTVVMNVPFINSANSTFVANEENVFVDINISYIKHGLDIATCIPYFLSLISLGLTISSLISHVLRLHRGAPSIGFFQWKGHVNVIITMTLLLILQLCCYLAQLCVRFDRFNNRGTLSWVYDTVILLFCPLEALILIYGNRKLCLACGFISCCYRVENLQLNE